MEHLLRELGPVCAQAADLLVSSAWKGLVLILGVAVLLRCLPRLSASVRSAVWTSVLVLVLLLPVLPFHGSAESATGGSVLKANAVWSFTIAGAWAALSLFRLLQLGASALRLRAIARNAVPVQACPLVENLLRQTSSWAGAVSLCVSADVNRPSVAGFFRPRILLPVGLLEELSVAELEHVVLHELEHLHRRDEWTNLLQKLSLALFPLHPALLWLDRRLCQERELACDEGVLRVTHARKAYAACLARLAEGSMVRRGLSLALGLLGMRPAGSELSGRVRRILLGPSTALSGAQAGWAAAVLLTGVVGGSLLLARSPHLISFASGVPELTAKAASAPVAMPQKQVFQQPLTTAPLQAISVKAVISSANTPVGPRLTRAVAKVSRRSSRMPLRQVAMAEESQAQGAGSAYALLAAWQQAMSMPHMTLAVATDSQVSQPTYAAFPVRGGWLLIQL